MRPTSLLVTIAVAGLLAGLVAAVFHMLASEPIIDQAIVLEEMRHSAAADSERVVSREAQKVGLFVGWAALGLTFATLLGGAYSLAARRGWAPIGPAAPLAFAVVGYCAFALLPGLKYPANPPGVGNPETIDFRQQAFVACWVLGVLGAVLSALVPRRLHLSPPAGIIVGVTTYAVWLGVLSFALPANPDPVTMPASLVAEFRVRSMVGLALFWAVLGTAFAWAASHDVRSNARLSPRPAS